MADVQEFKFGKKTTSRMWAKAWAKSMAFEETCDASVKGIYEMEQGKVGYGEMVDMFECKFRKGHAGKNVPDERRLKTKQEGWYF